MSGGTGDAQGCGCLIKGIDRRRLLGGLGGLTFGAVAPGRWSARAAEGDYEAMLLSCIDPRFVDPVHDYMAGRGLGGKYSQFTIAGAAIAVVAPKFEAWRQAFWDNFATSLTLHRITAVLAIDHRDCGAAKVAYGADSIKTPERETDLHRKVFERFRRELAKRHPEIRAETWLMAPGGAVEKLG